VCIEPHPRHGLLELAAESRVPIEVDPRPVQDVELGAFARLGPGDVLFIDSSHVSKLDSDVDRLYLEVVPSLAPGVVVHAHDVPWPHPAPDPERWVFRKHRFWNEEALLQAFLAFNSSFRVRLCASWLHREHRDALAAAVGGYDPSRHEPTSLWFERAR
jgi:methyltransferase family protein